MASDHYTFGPYKINPKEVFYSTQLSYAMVNLRPLLPGITFSPFSGREVKRFVDLTAEETSDLWFSAKNVGSQLEIFHKASSLTFTIQDGPEAGQTVPHVHIHILPRKANDFERNDEIYDAIDDNEKEIKQVLNLDKERKDRSFNEMVQEADEYRKLFLDIDRLLWNNNYSLRQADEPPSQDKLKNSHLSSVLKLTMVHHHFLPLAIWYM
ncbi:hypothetical protein SAY86_016164 [Trapa natans]|uniref:Bis(5'-adenosyl)-triphosphatase n=1 Tax=Trapa natans TaxID=22666 RepID=A0AAN7LKY1_TRANT|nr:hypothetical protein SAY86_016164 [Trapa natans]